MGHFIILMIWGICGLLLPEKEKQRMMQEEAEQWLQEQQENQKTRGWFSTP